MKFNSFFLFFLSFIFCLGGYSVSQGQVVTDKVDVLVIDPGHGGKDPGCVGKYTREKDVVLAVALLFGEKVKARYPDVKVVYTRSDDRFIELWKRGQIANDHHADLFVSIHCNAAGSSSARGYETWLRGTQKNAANLAEVQRENAVIYQEKDHEANYGQSWLDVVTATVHQDVGFENSIYFSSELQELYSKNIHQTVNRGIKQGPFYVLWKSARPSVLTELGFLSNPSEEKFLSSKEGQDKLAECLFRAFEKYKLRIDSRISTSGQEPSLADNDAPSMASSSSSKESASGSKEPASKETTPSTGNEVVVSESAEPDLLKDGAQDKKVSVAPSSTGDIVFKVQIAASGKKLELKPYNFRGLDELSLFYDKERKLYKYYYARSSSYEQIQKEMGKARKAGYGSAFIVAFEKGEPVSLQDAIEKSKR